MTIEGSSSLSCPEAYGSHGWGVRVPHSVQHTMALDHIYPLELSN